MPSVIASPHSLPHLEPSPPPPTPLLPVSPSPLFFTQNLYKTQKAVKPPLPLRAPSPSFPKPLFPPLFPHPPSPVVTWSGALSWYSQVHLTVACLRLYCGRTFAVFWRHSHLSYCLSCEATRCRLQTSTKCGSNTKTGGQSDNLSVTGIVSAASAVSIGRSQWPDDGFSGR